MILWMISALLTSALVAGAVVALEEALRLLRRPLRWSWAIGMTAAAILPVLSRFLIPAPAAAPTIGPTDPEALRALLAAAPVIERPAGLLERVIAGGVADPWLTAAWAAAALAMAVGLLLTQRRLQRIRSGGLPTRIAEVPVLLTHATGPMVVGLRRPQIVVPRWIDELSSEEQRLVLRHEWEHARAGDTRLLLLGALLVAAMPWNLPLWWMRRRLRQALEVDCDARVLAAGADRRLYGTMLIRTAGRPRTAPLIAPALVELPSLLERRIVAMTQRTPAHRHVRLGTAALLTALLFAAACELTPRDSSPSPTEPTLAEVLGAEEEDEAIVYEEAAPGQEAPISVVVLRGDGDGQVTVRGGGYVLRADSIRLQRNSLSTGSADPIVIVDGVRVESLENVDPDQIVSISVLKDAAATEQFGPEAADGAILVTTGDKSPSRVETIRRAPRIETVEGVEVVGYGAAERTTAAPAAERIEGATVVGYGATEPARSVTATVERTAAAIVRAAERSAAVAPLAEEIVVTGHRAAESVHGATAAPIATPAIRIRGAHTAVAAPAVAGVVEPQPLILVDGEEVKSLSSLNPNDIDEITVLKDESATDLYGARGRHGVILVKLKK